MNANSADIVTFIWMYQILIIVYISILITIFFISREHPCSNNGDLIELFNTLRYLALLKTDGQRICPLKSGVNIAHYDYLKKEDDCFSDFY